jgi:hypothetical protein
MPEPNTELIVPVLINGAVFATVAVIVPAFLLSRLPGTSSGVLYSSSSCLSQLAHTSVLLLPAGKC